MIFTFKYVIFYTIKILHNESVCKYNDFMIKKVIPLFLFTLLLTSCTDKQTKKEIRNHNHALITNQYVIEKQKEYNLKFEKLIESLTLEQKIAQLFIENLEGNTQFRSYETVGVMNGTSDKTPLVAGGYLFFSFNIAENREKMQAFTKSIRDYCVENNVIPPYLAVDQEGGWVTRLKKLNDKLPSNQDVAKNYSVNQAYELYARQALQMSDLGFHMNLAPVIEVCTEDNADFLDGRSYGSYSEVINYGRTCINAYENNNIATVVKHFPGNTNTDPHTGLPEITLSKKELEDSIQSFREILKYNPSSILMSHARTSAIDSGTPACLSSVWITDILRNQYGYEGIIFSDDIFMGALADNGYPPEKAAVMAIEAGIDCIMISEKRFGKSAKVLYEKARNDKTFEDKINNAVKRVIKYKINAGIIQVD